MLRSNKTATSMQKTYDECYLICSTAVYFEGQENEEEALRSWRSALDRIYYHNAYKVPPNYQPASATDKALQNSLHEMELQCKERVSLLDALRKSREEAEKGDEKSKKPEVLLQGPRPLPNTPKSPAPDMQRSSFPGWIGGGTVPTVSYDDIPSPNLLPGKRPPMPKSVHSDSSTSKPASKRHNSSNSQVSSKRESSSQQDSSRTPSPDKKTSMLRTTLRLDKNGKKASSSRAREVPKSYPPTAGVKAAGLAWDSVSKTVSRPDSTPGKESMGNENSPRRSSADASNRLHRPSRNVRPLSPPAPPSPHTVEKTQNYLNNSASGLNPPPRPPKHGLAAQQILLEQQKPSIPDKTSPRTIASPKTTSPTTLNYTKPPPDFLKYRSEYPPPEPVSQAAIVAAAHPPTMSRSATEESNPDSLPTRPKRDAPPPPVSRVSRRPVAHSPKISSSRANANVSSSEKSSSPAARRVKADSPRAEVKTPAYSDDEYHDPEPSLDSTDWRERLAYIKEHLPKGVDEGAAKAIFNEIVVQGDEVHWDDVAGLEAAKTALKEAVVYPFLRPDLFMGLREPARGMLLFGPPGTGKTMLARAVATESKSTFFAISASSLTSKWMGESEKLVRALFQLAKALAPSIIFVDEIDSLLSSRGDGEHETTRRIKTEFLIQWSDLQRAAAGKEAKNGEGDPTRVLVLAATNLPWAIDEAARRRFVRRQYIPLPEPHVREQQMRTLLSHQKHTLSKDDIKVLVEVTDGYSGSDITALAKDAAMGPLRSLGESLLHMSPDQIRPIICDDFEASLVNIRPSVSKQGLKEFEDWAREFGERAG